MSDLLRSEGRADLSAGERSWRSADRWRGARGDGSAPRVRLRRSSSSHRQCGTGRRPRCREAKAFTSGTDIWFGARPGPEDSGLLAHELAHVVQQAQGRTNALAGLGGNPHARERLERDASRPPGAWRKGASPVPGQRALLSLRSRRE